MTKRSSEVSPYWTGIPAPALALTFRHKATRFGASRISICSGFITFVPIRPRETTTPCRATDPLAQQALPAQQIRQGLHGQSTACEADNGHHEGFPVHTILAPSLVASARASLPGRARGQ